MNRREFLKAGAAATLLGTAISKTYGSTTKTTSGQLQSIRPRLMITGEKIKGLRSVDELRQAIKEGHSKKLWDAMMVLADDDLSSPPISGSDLSDPGICRVCNRLLRQGLAALITGDKRYRDNCLSQLECLFDTSKWPTWIHPSQVRDVAPDEFGLRHGMLVADIAFAYDWIYPSLTSAQRRDVINGLDVRAIRPYFQSLSKNRSILHDRLTNFTPTIFGSVGIVGMALGSDYPQSEQLLSTADGKMKEYLTVYGPDGSHNESNGYAFASLYDVVRYFAYTCITTILYFPVPLARTHLAIFHFRSFAVG